MSIAIHKHTKICPQTDFATVSDVGMMIYLYDGDNVIADLNTSGEVVRSHVTPGLDSNVSMTVHDSTTTTYYYNQDERQSVMNLTNATGVVAQSYAYSAYGDKLRSQVSSLIPNRYTYTGRELSDTTGDFYFRYRTYSAGTGSFMSRDPLGYVDGESLYYGYFAAGMGLDPQGTDVKSFDKNIKDLPWKTQDSGYAGFASKISMPTVTEDYEEIEYETPSGEKTCMSCIILVDGAPDENAHYVYNPDATRTDGTRMFDNWTFGKSGKFNGTENSADEAWITSHDGRKVYVKDHEFAHARIYKEWWNRKMVAMLGAYDHREFGTTCCPLIKAYLEIAKDVSYARYRQRTAQVDVDDYGHGQKRREAIAEVGNGKLIERTELAKLFTAIAALEKANCPRVLSRPPYSNP